MANKEQIQKTLVEAGVATSQLDNTTKLVQQRGPNLQKTENVLTFGNFIAASEGTGKYGNRAYNVGFGNRMVEDLSKHPGYAAPFKQTDGTKNRSTAFGKYQMLESTDAEMSKITGLYDQLPASQEAKFVALLKQNGALGMVEAGDFTGAIKKLGPIWASLPTAPDKYKQPKHSWETANKMLQAATGTSLGAPDFNGNLPKGPKKPILSERNILAAALPTAEENMAEASRREAIQAQQDAELQRKQADIFAIQDNAEATKRSADIDAMLSKAFGFDDTFKKADTLPTVYDAQLLKLIKQA